MIVGAGLRDRSILSPQPQRELHRPDWMMNRPVLAAAVALVLGSTLYVAPSNPVRPPVRERLLVAGVAAALPAADLKTA